MYNYEYDTNINCLKFARSVQKSLSSVLSPNKDKVIINSINEESDLQNQDWFEGKMNENENDDLVVFPLGTKHTTETQSHSRIPLKHKSKIKKSAVGLLIPAYESFSLLKCAKSNLNYILFIFLKVIKFVFIYGTELIIQTLAISTLATVMILKLVESFVRNRYLNLFICYIEKIDFTNLSFPNFSIDFFKILKNFKHFFWIFKKLFEFNIIIVKHVVIQLIFMIFFIFSWVIYYIGSLISHFMLLPFVNRTMNVLHVDGETVSTITKFHLTKNINFAIVYCCNILPLISEISLNVVEVRHNIVKVTLIKEIILDIILSIKKAIKSAMEIVKDISDICKLFLELHETFIGIILLMCNTLSLIGFMIFTIFFMLNHIGYAMAIFINGFKAGSNALAQLKKI